MRISMRVLFAVIALLTFVLPRAARADQGGGHTVPVAVLSFDSEDAEDQADAFTGALRSRIRAAQGWSLIETAQSLGMLTAALKCPSRPPPDCQTRIGEQIKAERYIWGYVTKGPQSGQVTAEIHLYQKGKADTVIKENYADNLKDQNDDTLRKIAARVLERLGGNAVGVVIVKGPGDLNGEVIVDGDKKVPVQNGNARIELAPGSHAIEVVPTTGAPTKRTVLITAGKESVVDIAAPAPAGGGTGPTEPTEPSKPFPTKKVVGGVALAVGVGLGVLAVQQFLHWNDLQDKGDEIAPRVPKDQAPCEGSDEEFCNTDKDARTASAISIAPAGVGAILIGTGVYFLFISGDSSSEKAATAAPKPKTRFSPTFGTNGGGFSLSGSF